ncbi:MAG: glycoside hydrolase family 3 C-terminal domain-containing protein [Acidobacteria bacterium]|nr:glycoside hydrolase family 3 C-terminal domain-containing protein [Acidobacteriota bacterium]
MKLIDLPGDVPRRGARVIALLAVPCCLAQFTPREKPTGPWMDKSLSPDRRAELVMREMTRDEKIQLVHGAGMVGIGKSDPVIVRSNGGGGFVPGIPRLGLPDLNMNDSSVGSGGGARKGRYSTAMPSSLALASGWDANLARDVGALIGRELADQGYNVSLGGGVNITREPRNGRNFEYLGEDPILAGNLVAAWIQGVQSEGVIGDIKHYAVNDQETGRYFTNAIIGKRELRETDLLAFEIGVKRGKPGMVMCSYNLINGAWACENEYTLNQVLKKEWGFPGWVISDWFGTHSTVKAANAGLDQEQPDGRYFSDALKKAIDGGEVSAARLDDMVHRILRTEFAAGIVDDPRPSRVPDIFRGFSVAQRAAEETMVLLKNQDARLPLNAASLRSIAVIGGHADAGVLSGGGSAQVDAAGGNAVPDPNLKNDILSIFSQVVFHRSSPLRAIREAAPSVKVTFDPGTDPAAAAAAAKAADVAIVFVLQHTSEGKDQASLALPDGQDALVERVAAANPRTIVVIESGGPVLLPWAGKVSAILEAWYPGIRGGEAIANVLFGTVNPSGKLAVTFPTSDSDLPRATVPAPPGKMPSPLDGLTDARPPFPASYDEGLKVGYKWFDAEKKAPAYPFGFGLSYSTFAYSDLKVTGGNSLAVNFTVRNTSRRAGAEVAQVYLSFPDAANEPPKRLIGWEKIALKPGESRVVSLAVDPLYVSVFDAAAEAWKIVPGEYRVMAGPSSAALPLAAKASLAGAR